MVKRKKKKKRNITTWEQSSSRTLNTRKRKQSRSWFASGAHRSGPYQLRLNAKGNIWSPTTEDGTRRSAQDSAIQIIQRRDCSYWRGNGAHRGSGAQKNVSNKIGVNRVKAPTRVSAWVPPTNSRVPSTHQSKGVNKIEVHQSKGASNSASNIHWSWGRYDLIKKIQVRSQQDCLQQAQYIGREDDLIKKIQVRSQQDCLQQAQCIGREDDLIKKIQRNGANKKSVSNKRSVIRNDTTATTVASRIERRHQL
jgi:hypothetical protein